MDAYIYIRMVEDSGHENVQGDPFIYPIFNVQSIGEVLTLTELLHYAPKTLNDT